MMWELLIRCRWHIGPISVDQCGRWKLLNKQGRSFFFAKEDEWYSKWKGMRAPHRSCRGIPGMSPKWCGGKLYRCASVILVDASPKCTVGEAEERESSTTPVNRYLCFFSNCVATRPHVFCAAILYLLGMP